MLSLSRPATARCTASSTRSTGLTPVLRIGTPTAATAAASSDTTAKPRRCGNFHLRQRSARRITVRPLAAVPDDRQSGMGSHPESGSGSSNSGRMSGKPSSHTPSSQQKGDNVGSAPESGTRPDADIAPRGTGSTYGSTSGSTMKSAAGGGGGGGGERSGRSTEDSYTSAIGMEAPQSKGSPALNERTRVSRTGDMTGELPGGPADVLMGRNVESSDTNPALDPAESDKYMAREGGAENMAPQFRSDKDTQQGRDETDREGRGDTGGSDSSQPRVHPAARTAATAIGSAAGTVLGAVGGPVGAAAGAALGGRIGRKVADAMGGTEEQAEIYEQGAEPEQVAEELLSAGNVAGERLSGAGDKAADVASDVAQEAKGAAAKAQAAAGDLVDRTSERLSSSDTSGGSSSTSSMKANYDTSRMRGEVDFGTPVEYKSSTASATDKPHHVDKDAKEQGKGLAAKVKDTVAGAAHKAVDKIEHAAEGVPLPTFPPATGKEDEPYASAAGSFVGEGQTGFEQGAAKVGDRIQGAAEAVRDSVSSTARTAQDKADDTARTARDRADQMSSGRGSGGGAGATTATARGGLEDSEARAASAGWGGEGQKEEWGGVGDWTSAEAAVKSTVGTPMDMQAGPSMIHSDAMDLPSQVYGTGSAQAAGGYGGGEEGLGWNVDTMREQGGLAAADMKTATAGSTSGGGATGVRAVDEGLPEGVLAAGGDDAQAATHARRGESSAETTSDSTAERVAQVYGVKPEASPGVEEAETYRAEAGQEGAEGNKGSS